MFSCTLRLFTKQSDTFLLAFLLKKQLLPNLLSIVFSYIAPTGLYSFLYLLSRTCCLYLNTTLKYIYN